jgi:hypothetical protein
MEPILWEKKTIEEARQIALDYGITDDLFVDNNFRTLQLLMWFGLTDLEGRQGHDVCDDEGHFYQLKTTGTGRVFSTSQCFTRSVLRSYRETTYWIFGVCSQTPGQEFLVTEVYLVRTKDLEPWFVRQEKKLDQVEAKGGSRLNDPRIRLSLVKKIGVHVKNPKPKNTTRKEFFNMILNDQDEFDKGLIGLRNLHREKNKAQEELQSYKLCTQQFLAELGVVLSPTLIDIIWGRIKNKTGIDAEQLLTSKAPAVAATPADASNTITDVVDTGTGVAASPTDRVEDEVVEKILLEFIKERVEIINDPSYYVSENTFKKYLRKWYKAEYGKECPNKRAHITRAVFAKVGIVRDKSNGRLLNIKRIKGSFNDRVADL